MNNHHELEVYLEKRASRVFVGLLRKASKEFIFEYSKDYAYSKNSISLGPDLPLSKRLYRSKTLFPFFLDRIPSKENPAYAEYCKKLNIPVDESNEIILLSTIGRKGPSSFIFELKNEIEYKNTDYMKFRNDLKLTMRDFASLFQISLSSLQSLNKNSNSGKEVLKRIEIYDKFPEVAIYEVSKNKRFVHNTKYETTIEQLNKKKLISNIHPKSSL